MHGKNKMNLAPILLYITFSRFMSDLPPLWHGRYILSTQLLPGHPVKVLYLILFPTNDSIAVEDYWDC